MTQEISTYEKQAIDFLNAVNTEFSAKFLRNGKYFDDDKDERDIYEITLKRGARKYVFTFGQSIAKSGRWIVKDVNPKLTRTFNSKSEAYSYASKIGAGIFKVKENRDMVEPTPYYVLACLTKYEVGSFENFCSEYGYDTDSRMAEKIYKSVLDEWHNVKMLFSDDEIELLQEIQ